MTCNELTVKEETIYSLLSAQVSSKIMIENPNPTTALTYTIENSNHNAFTSHPKSSFIVQHSSQEIVKINYRPTKSISRDRRVLCLWGGFKGCYPERVQVRLSRNRADAEGANNH